MNKTDFEFQAVLGRWGHNKKILQSAISMLLFRAISFDFMWKMNEKLDFLDSLASALKSYTILKQKKIRFLLRSMPFGAKISYMPYFK